MDSVPRGSRAPALVGLTRRGFVGWTLGSLAPLAAVGRETHQATGVKVGELTPTAARIWARRTRANARRSDGIPARREKPLAAPTGVDPIDFEGSCPGADGALRLIVKTSAGKKAWASDWVDVSASTDFAHQFEVSGLRPATGYSFLLETKGRRTDGQLTGSFRTAPPEDAVVPVDVAMLSCQKYSQRDDARGFFVYDAIKQFQPHHLLSVGDNVYYDSDDPIVNSTAVARHHWNRMYSLDRVAECLRVVPGYWVKDDHDCYSDDCYPGMVTPKMAPFTFQEGLQVFPTQVPLGPSPYRRYRWGRGLEIFLLEGRDYRTANNAPDSPSKSIWGPEQKRWLKEALTASKADWKLIVSPTPWVGPDRKNKRDNHANEVYRTEGREMRAWIKDNSRGDTFVLCGDRHWQYHSVEPETGVNEFGCGAASDSHAAGTPGEDLRYHKFHRVKGGFLAIQVRPEGGRSKLVIEHCDVNGRQVYQKVFERSGALAQNGGKRV
ncbi:MAG: alkaline phosphatase D family protein [Bryobacterales bacterium]|nr:alkaline phosphatase D family protein [Bryobacterales bacterium]